MKRIFKIAAVLCFVFLLVGCGGDKKLSCSKDFSAQLSQGISMVQDADISFSNDKVTKLVMVMHFELPESLSSYLSQLMSTMDSTYQSQYGKYTGVKVTTKQVSDTKFDVTIDMDYANLDSSSKTAMGFVGSDESYATTKSSLEKQGYACK